MAAPPVAAPGGVELIERTPHVRATPRGPLSPGRQIRLDVFADRARFGPGETGHDVTIHAQAGQTKFDLEVWLAASSHFALAEPRTARLTIMRDRDESTHATFRATVQPAPDTDDDPVVNAYFFYQGRPCGRVTRTFRLQGSNREATDGASEGGLHVETGAVQPDLTVVITDPTQSRRQLECRVIARALPPEEQPPVGDWFLPQESGLLVRQFMEQFVRPGISNADRIASLTGAGCELFDAAPQVFRDLFWKLLDSGRTPRSILIVSDEPFIPWELMVPRRHRADGRVEQLRPLGVEFAISRWLHRQFQPPAQRVPLTDSYVIAPEYTDRPKPLRHAGAEAGLVLGTIPGDRIVPAERQTIESTVSHGRSLIHFICHGADSPGNGIQVLYLAGGTSTVSSLEIGQWAGLAAGFLKRPLIFLNACEVGRPNVSLVGIGGFAKAFIDMGASGVIAPLWSVRDVCALDVATRFYHEVQRAPSRPFAEVLREIRALAYDRAAGEDTYAAYCYYGDPLAARA